MLTYRLLVRSIGLLRWGPGFPVTLRISLWSLARRWLLGSRWCKSFRRVLVRERSRLPKKVTSMASTGVRAPLKVRLVCRSSIRKIKFLRRCRLVGMFRILHGTICPLDILARASTLTMLIVIMVKTALRAYPSLVTILLLRLVRLGWVGRMVFSLILKRVGRWGRGLRRCP